MQATALPSPFEGFGPFSQAAETKFGEQMLWQHGLDTSATHWHSFVMGVWALHQTVLMAGLWCLYFSNSSQLTKNQILNLL